MDYNHKADQADLKSRDEELYNIVMTACAIRDELSFEKNGEPYGKSETEKHLYDCIERWRNRLDAVLNPSYEEIDIDEDINLEDPDTEDDEDPDAETYERRERDDYIELSRQVF